MDAEMESNLKLWTEFFRRYMRSQVNEAVLSVGVGRCVLDVDFNDVQTYNLGLAERIVASPVQELLKAEEAVKVVDVPLERVAWRVRLKNLPEQCQVKLRDARSTHLGKLVSVYGLANKLTTVSPKVQDALYQCVRCGGFIREAQEEHQVLSEPLECYEDQGGCGRESKFKLIIEETRGNITRFVDTQRLDLQENPDALEGGEQPVTLPCWVEEELCNAIKPGERVRLNGVLRAKVIKRAGVKSSVLELYLEVCGVERDAQDEDEVKVSQEEEALFKDLANDPELVEVLKHAIAPEMFGMDRVKEAVLCQLFGGVEKVSADGTSTMRGDIHILVPGDPGVAKSQLIKQLQAKKFVPRSVFTSGKGASAAGLTAAAVRDEVDGKWTFEAGAMVLSDRGILFVDELDKMGKNDVSGFHEGMEQQTVTVTKAGMNVTLKTRCSVLAVCNPKLGRFAKDVPIPEQLNFPPALLSRFDIIIVMIDEPNVKHDEALARHILGVHQSSAGKAAKVLMSNEMVRKYIAYAKRTCKPKLGPGVVEALTAYYVKLRSKSKAEGSIQITARQLQALVRLSEARAKIRLQDVVTEEDARASIELFEFSMTTIAGTKTGFDLDIVMTGVRHTLMETAAKVLQVVRARRNDSKWGVAEADVLEEMVGLGYVREKVLGAVHSLLGRGQLFEMRAGYYRAVVE